MCTPHLEILVDAPERRGDLPYIDASRNKKARLGNLIDTSVLAEEGGASGDLPEGLKLEDPGALLTPGTKDGQIKVTREEGVGMAYSWNAAK